jgi:hypothetical protein
MRVRSLCRAVALAASALSSFDCGGGGGASGPATATSPAPPQVQACGGSGPGLVIVLEPALAAAIRPHLETFEQDLCREGYAVTETVHPFASPPELRAFLLSLYEASAGRLEGAYLVGDHPRAYQWITSPSSSSIPSTSEEAISYQYYCDLDGRFEASSSYRSPAGRSFSYDTHRGDVDWEIWVGVLPGYQGDVARTAEAVGRYFAKNHAYRTGPAMLPRGFLQVSELFTASTRDEHDRYLSAMRDGPMAWTPFSVGPSARLYFDSPAGGLSVDQGYVDLGAGVADFAVQEAHGYWGASGRLDIAWVEERPVRTSFFWSDGCAVANLDWPANFLTSLLYSPSSLVVLAHGTTASSAGMGHNLNGSYGHNVAVAMTRGDSMGRAVLEHVNTPLVEPWASTREYHVGTAVLLGDPSLKLRP